MDSKKETPRKSPEKKSAPPANNALWYLLVVGVLCLITFVYFFNPSTDLDVPYSDLLQLIAANDPEAKEKTVDVLVGVAPNLRSERLSGLKDVEIQSFKITGYVEREKRAKAESAQSDKSTLSQPASPPAKNVPEAGEAAATSTDTAVVSTDNAVKKEMDWIQFSTDRQPDETLVAAALSEHKVPFRYAKGPSKWSSFLPMVLLTGLIIFVFIVMMRRLGGAGSPMAFGRSRGKLYAQEEIDIMFDDVAGIEEAVEEVREVVEFLRTPEKYQMLGGRIPKGILLVGPPGTGKTLLGKAIAGEAGVPFFSLSGSDFVEMFVGVGAARVRDMFQQAEAKAPCIIFIDELDALGKTRGSGAVGGHDEREQTLNALLVEMDGFDSNSGVIVLGATNRPETLDPALLRPGRFDRHVLVDRPDVAGRKEILEVHMRNVKVAPNVDVKQIAAITSGFVGADLANLVNEAALLAARNGKSSVGMQEFNEGVERVTAGLEKKQRIMLEEEKRRVAFHESGHALVAYSLPNTDPVHKVSIIPRGLAALGYTMQRPEQDRFLMTQGELESRIQVLLGGTIAEEAVFEDVSTGAQNDLERATEIARAMVMDYGMSRLGRVTYRESGRSPFLVSGGDASARLHGFSEQTAREIDEEVKRIIDESMERVRHIIANRKDALVAMSMLLLEQEVIDADELRDVMEKNSPSPRIVPGTDVEHKRPAADTANIDASEFEQQKEAN